MSIILNCSGKKKEINPDINLVEDYLLNLSQGDYLEEYDGPYLKLEIGKNFIIAILICPVNNKKFFRVRYFDYNKRKLFESDVHQNYYNTINLFNLFLLEDRSFKNTIKWEEYDGKITSKGVAFYSTFDKIKQAVISVVVVILVAFWFLFLHSPNNSGNTLGSDLLSLWSKIAN